SPSRPRRWRSGRLGGLKSRCPQGRVGSNPTRRTRSGRGRRSLQAAGSARRKRAVAAGLLGVVERAVGPADQGVGRLLPVPGGDPGRRRLVGDRDRSQALYDLEPPLERAVREQQPELLAAVAGEQVARAQHLAPGGGDLLEQPVPGLVAALVVVLLEVVE